MEEQVNRIGGLYDTENQKHQAGSIYDKEGLAPTLDTASGGHRQPLIWERYNNKALNETLSTNQVESGDFIDAYNRVVKKDIAGTIKTTVNTSNMTFVADGKTQNNDINLSPTLDTRCDCLGVCVKDERHPYELSDAMKKYIVSKDDKYQVSNGNLKVNRDIACSKTTREGCTRADASDYISPDLMPNENIANKNPLNYRIRKLTPKECGRLMGVKDEDIDKMSVNQSNSKLYHLYGDSIVTNCLCEIFKQML